MFNATVILDSQCSRGTRLTTMELTYPRFIHAEFMTHRVFSRNASSSRAIPAKKLVEMAINQPAHFIHIGMNEPGMQANAEVSQEIQEQFYREWVALMSVVATSVRRWTDSYNIHKQVANRAMEPWHHIKVIVSATEWDNFWWQRCHPAAQPEMRHLAELMRAAYLESVPEIRDTHFPYITADDERDVDRYIAHEEGLNTFDKPHILAKISAARCARVSYMNHDGTRPNIRKDLDLFDKLAVRPQGSEDPVHLSPLEHPSFASGRATDHANFKGWRQLRKEFER
jgi:thymidylate synthase ThyX